MELWSSKACPGRLQLHLHRPLPDHASIRSCTLTREGRASCIALQIEVVDVHTVRQKAGNLVGIDWGVERLVTLSTGETVANPGFGAAAARRIGKAQRKLARAARGSRRRLKAVAHLARRRRGLANRRKSYLHQLTAAIAARFGATAVEDLKVKRLTTSAKGTVERPGKNVRQKAGLNREILEVSPGMMISMLRYKAERAGGWFAVDNARNTSQECSQCGRTVQKDLSVRIHRCAHCKMEVHRDVNAARKRPETGRSGS